MEDHNLLIGVGLAIILINAFIFAIAHALNSTMETLVRKAYNEGNYYDCGVNLNRTKLITLVILLPVIVTFFFLDRILIRLAINSEVARITRDYIVCTLPGVLA